jgi:hypothetical protein
MLTPAHVRGLAIIVYALGAAVAFDGPALLLALGLGTALVALTAERRASAVRPRYRLEHRGAGRVRVVAAMRDELPGRTALQAEAAALTLAGASGQLVLVDATTGHPITWQVLAPQTPAPSQDAAEADGARL